MEVVKKKASSKSSSCSSSSNDIDAWDDRLLIDKYNLCIEKVKKRLNIESQTEKLAPESCWDHSNKDDPSKDNWKKDDFCRAKFSKDNRYYEAIFLQKSPEDNTCLVKFIGYNNLEVRPIEELKPSEGDKARLMQERDAVVEFVLKKDHSSSSSSKDETNKPSIFPPTPLFLAGDKVTQEDSALSSMLMSWYMCGYHTGYYKALKKFDISDNE